MIKKYSKVNCSGKNYIVGSINGRELYLISSNSQLYNDIEVLNDEVNTGFIEMKLKKIKKKTKEQKEAELRPCSWDGL